MPTAIKVCSAPRHFSPLARPLPPCGAGNCAAHTRTDSRNSPVSRGHVWFPPQAGFLRRGCCLHPLPPPLWGQPWREEPGCLCPARAQVARGVLSGRGASPAATPAAPPRHPRPRPAPLSPAVPRFCTDGHGRLIGPSPPPPLVARREITRSTGSSRRRAMRRPTPRLPGPAAPTPAAS